MNKYIKFSLNSEDTGLFSRHYVLDILPTTERYQKFKCNNQLEKLKSTYNLETLNKLSGRGKLSEREIETILENVFQILNLNFKLQAPVGSKFIDFVMYSGSEFVEDFSNSYVLCDAKRVYLLQNKYHITKQSNDDPIFQIKYYLKEVNNQLFNIEAKPIDFAFLTDGLIWRIYSRFFTHNDYDFESNFIEFDLGKIFAEKNDEVKNDALKMFLFFFNYDSWNSNLIESYHQSGNLSKEVTKELKSQVFTALELLSTGLWREIKYDPVSYKHKLESYGIDITKIDDTKVRRRTLDVIYTESMIYLLRLLFLLYCEDRDLFKNKVIKKTDGILSRIRKIEKGIGQITENHTELNINFDVDISNRFHEIDREYNGGIFSGEKHQLIHKLDIDNIIYANVIDNICRVYVKDDKGKKPTTVDFGSISVRELGSIYEGLLEYKLDEIENDNFEIESLVDKTKKRLNVKKGDLLLVNHKGERKSTGSYYTPDTIVDYLVKTTIGKHITSITEESIEAKEKIKKILAIKICDPAMGSGHFLIKAFDIVTHALLQIQEENPESIKNQDIRSTVVRKCIFGVDLNPLAVDLAKMIFWIKTFRTDKALEFYEANLKCGNSLLGIFEDESSVPKDIGKNNNSDQQFIMFRAEQEIEADILKKLSQSTLKLLNMPNKTREDIQKKYDYYQNNLILQKKNVTFIYHLKLIKYLYPEKSNLVDKHYEALLGHLDKDHNFILKIYQNNRSGILQLFKHEETQVEIAEIFDTVEAITRHYSPVHWQVEFPHIFLNGGFDFVLGNPPWDIIKPDHNKFFSDYIEGYSRLETKVAKKESEQLCSDDLEIADKYNEYLDYYEKSNRFFNDAYTWQVVTGVVSNSKLSGDNNLYKIFIEKANEILKKNGSCGFVVPSGLNSDRGCTGLRRLLFENSMVENLIMFENRRGIFPDVHRQYKFDVLVFHKSKPRKNHKMSVGSYWQDPWWLSQEEEWKDTTGKLDFKQEKKIHEQFKYPTSISEKLAPDTMSLVEMRVEKDIKIVEKFLDIPLFVDESQNWYGRVYNEYHMTKDSDIFNTENEGYKLLEGKCIHHFDPYFAEPTRYVISDIGEERLAARWKLEKKDLPNRKYRIGFRSIGRSTDSRTLITTLLPRYVFCGNSINLIEIQKYNSYFLTSGITSVLNSLTIDYLIRFRVSANVNAFYIKQIPLIRDTEKVEALGRDALPLFYGKDFKELRGDVSEIPPADSEKRLELRAYLDAKIGLLYNMSYEDMQHIMTNFPLVDENYKEDVLRKYREL